MSDAESLMLEHLKRRDAEEVTARDCDLSILSRLARISRDESSNYAELLEVRHAVDKLWERVERIEHRLDIS